MKTLIMAMLFLQGPPSIDTWKEVTKTHYEVKNSVKLQNKIVTTTSFVGSFGIYKNPNSESEFAFIIYKYPAITFLPQVIRGESKSLDEILTAEKYFYKIKLEKLNERFKMADIIAFVRWSENKDQRTGEKILMGPIESWLLSSKNEWFFVSNTSATIKTELVSEPSRNSAKKIILVGFKFSLGKNYHILRFDQNHLGGEK